MRTRRYSMLIAGTIICGGGPVVIPLLRGYTVDPGWVSRTREGSTSIWLKPVPGISGYIP